MPPKRIGIVAHIEKPHAGEIAALLCGEFEAAGIEVRLESATADLIGRKSSGLLSEICVCSDMMVVLGGDGTMLRALHGMTSGVIPLFGINLGSLGFLTGVPSSEASQAAQAVIAGDYQLSSRAMLTMELIREGEVVSSCLGLNDAVISRGEISRLIRLKVHIDGQFLTEYNADGLIVATPTGSTAYSLSAGGPILMPESNSFVITPICPHVLTNRSVIVSNSSTITVMSADPRQEHFLTIDGQNILRIEPGDTIRLARAAADLPLVILNKVTFSELLRMKLKWSGSNL